MEIHVHIHYAPDPRLDELLRLARASLKQEHHIMASLADLDAKVTEQTDVITSATTLLAELKSELDAAVASGDLSQVQAIVDHLGQNTDALAAAVAANTPADPGTGAGDPGTVLP